MSTIWLAAKIVVMIAHLGFLVFNANQPPEFESVAEGLAIVSFLVLMLSIPIGFLALGDLFRCYSRWNIINWWLLTGHGCPEAKTT